MIIDDTFVRNLFNKFSKNWLGLRTFQIGLLLNCKLIGSTQSYLFEEWEVADALCITTKLSK